ncbi:hypothetical protein QLX67_13920, partial [Balneolaceae bacterium ANBcel3]|nr:hypothetical protein [Balneolaceae bacterium ANBcel3]
MSKTFNIEKITPENYKDAPVAVEVINDFLHTHLDRFRDPKHEIQNCLDYALGITPHRRGFILAAVEEKASDGSHQSRGGKNVLGVVVMCETG